MIQKRFLHQYIIFLFLPLVIAACDANDNALTVGENIINDDHYASYTEDLEIYSETLLAAHVKTNNTGVALIGSYKDPLIGTVSANTVFKISPDIFNNDSRFDDIYLEYDSLELLLTPTGYLYGDSTVPLSFTVNQVLEDYDYDTIFSEYSDDFEATQLNNNSPVPYKTTPIVSFSFIPEELYGEPVSVLLPDSIGQLWFDKISNGEDYYTKDVGSTDWLFIQEILNGLTIRSSGNNQAIMGFHMSTSDAENESTITLRMHYHLSEGDEEAYFDFPIYDARLQYNQVSADFTGTVLEGIEAGGEGIPSTDIGGMSFISAGVGLMTKVEIPTLNELFRFGSNCTVLNFDLEYKAIPVSFTDGISLPTVMAAHKLLNSGIINYNPITDLTGENVNISMTEYTENEATFIVPLTSYAIDEQDVTSIYSDDHTSILLRSTSLGTYPSNVNRIALGDFEQYQAEMVGKLYYTTFEN